MSCRQPASIRRSSPCLARRQAPHLFGRELLRARQSKTSADNGHSTFGGQSTTRQTKATGWPGRPQAPPPAARPPSCAALTAAADGRVQQRLRLAGERLHAGDVVPERPEDAAVLLQQLQLQPLAGAVARQRIVVHHAAVYFIGIAVCRLQSAGGRGRRGVAMRSRGRGGRRELGFVYFFVEIVNSAGSFACLRTSLPALNGGW